MAPPEWQNRGPRNAAFLLLDLGNNTVGFGSSSAFSMSSEALPPIVAEKNCNPNSASIVDSSSTEEEASELSGKVTKIKDPDWLPEKKLRKSSSSCRTIKSKPGPFIRNNTLDITPPPSVNDNPREISPGTGNGTPSPATEPPARHLVSLLNMSGWKVAFKPDIGDYVYISPTGVTFSSLSKAFDTYMHGTSKYNENASNPFQSSKNRALNGNYIQELPASVSNFGQPSGAAASERGKKGRGTKRRNSTVAENMKATKPTEEPLLIKHDAVRENGEQSLQMPGKAICQDVNPVVSTCKENEKTSSCVKSRCLDNVFKQMACSRNLDRGSNRDLHSLEVLLGIRSSTQINKQHVPVGSVMDIAGTSNSGLYMSACGSGGDAMKDKNKQMTATSQTKNEVRNSDCGNVGVIGSGQISSSSMGKDINSLGVRRSRRVNRKIVHGYAEVDEEMEVENSCLALVGSVVSSAAQRHEGKSLVPEAVLDEKMHTSMDSRRLNGETKMYGCSSTVISSQPNTCAMNHCGVVGIRRSTRIKGKHVPVDDELDVEMCADDEYFDLSEFTDTRMAKKDKEKLTTSFSIVDNMKGGGPASDGAQVKQTSTNKSDNQKLKAQKQPGGRNSKKNGKATKLMSEKCSAVIKDMRVENSVAEKCSLLSAAKKNSSYTGNSNVKKKAKRNRGCGLAVRSRKNDHHDKLSSQAKLCMLSWLIDHGILTENEKAVFITKNNTCDVSSGSITREGILCDCCQAVLPLLKFKAQVGSNLHRPWDNIFLLSGKTFLQCLKEAWEKEKKQRKVGFQRVGTDGPDPSDDTCGVCADGGHLICCDSCPSTFHQDCLMLKALPEGIWCCPYCRCAFCMVAEHGLDRALKTLTLLTCNQCRCKYHLECAWEKGAYEMDKVPNLFCSENCKKIADRLSDMVGTSNPIEGGFSWTLLKRFDEDEGAISNERLSFIMESNAKLSMALTVLDECFVPLLDRRTGLDMICQAVYNCGSNFNRLNYEGFYTLILEKDEEIISAASLRFHGTKLAEMPFIGTRPTFRRQGMCRRLLKAIDDMLSSLYVEKLIIPAIHELLETWMTSFSFKHLESSHKDEIRNLSMVIFAEATLLQKPICNTRAMGKEGNMKDGQKARETPSSYGDYIHSEGYVAAGQYCWGHECNFKEQKDASAESCRVTNNSIFPPGLLTIPYSFKGQKSAILEPYKMIKDSRFTPSSLTGPHSKISTGSVPETSAINSTYVPSLNMMPQPQNLSSTPFSFPAVNVVRDNDHVSSEIFPVPSSQNTWLQSGDEAEDIHDGAIRGTLAFENLLRIGS